MATLSRIAPEIPVPNLKDAIDYYCEKLGFELAMQLPSGDYAIVERDGVAIHLFEQVDGAVPVAMHIFTPQLNQLHSELSARGADIRSPSCASRGAIVIFAWRTALGMC